MGVSSHLEYRSEEKTYSGTRASCFFCRIPEGYQDLAETKEAQKICEIWTQRGRKYVAVVGKTEAEAEANYEVYMDMYFKAKTVEEKVLLFMHKSKLPDRGDSRFYDNDKEVSLEFDFKVCKKKTIGSASKYYEILKNDREKEVTKNSYYGDKWHEIPYDEMSEAYLKSIRTGMIDLIKKFDKFIGGPKQIIETIESKQKLISA